MLDVHLLQIRVCHYRIPCNWVVIRIVSPYSSCLHSVVLLASRFLLLLLQMSCLGRLRRLKRGFLRNVSLNTSVDSLRSNLRRVVEEFEKEVPLRYNKLRSFVDVSVPGKVVVPPGDVGLRYGYVPSGISRSGEKLDKTDFTSLTFEEAPDGSMSGSFSWRAALGRTKQDFLGTTISHPDSDDVLLPMGVDLLRLLTCNSIHGERVLEVIWARIRAFVNWYKEMWFGLDSVGHRFKFGLTADRVIYSVRGARKDWDWIDRLISRFLKCNMPPIYQIGARLSEDMVKSEFGRFLCTLPCMYLPGVPVEISLTPDGMMAVSSDVRRIIRSFLFRERLDMEIKFERLIDFSIDYLNDPGSVPSSTGRHPDSGRRRDVAFVDPDDLSCLLPSGPVPTQPGRGAFLDRAAATGVRRPVVPVPESRRGVLGDSPTLCHRLYSANTTEYPKIPLDGAASALKRMWINPEGFITSDSAGPQSSLQVYHFDQEVAERISTLLGMWSVSETDNVFDRFFGHVPEGQATGEFIREAAFDACFTMIKEHIARRLRDGKMADFGRSVVGLVDLLRQHADASHVRQNQSRSFLLMWSVLESFFNHVITPPAVDASPVTEAASREFMDELGRTFNILDDVTVTGAVAVFPPEVGRVLALLPTRLSDIIHLFSSVPRQFGYLDWPEHNDRINKAMLAANGLVFTKPFLSSFSLSSIKLFEVHLLQQLEKVFGDLAKVLNPSPGSLDEVLTGVQSLSENSATNVDRIIALLDANNRLHDELSVDLTARRCLTEQVTILQVAKEELAEALDKLQLREHELEILVQQQRFLASETSAREPSVASDVAVSEESYPGTVSDLEAEVRRLEAEVAKNRRVVSSLTAGLEARYAESRETARQLEGLGKQTRDLQASLTEASSENALLLQRAENTDRFLQAQTLVADEERATSREEVARLRSQLEQAVSSRAEFLTALTSSRRDESTSRSEVDVLERRLRECVVENNELVTERDCVQKSIREKCVAVRSFLQDSSVNLSSSTTVPSTTKDPVLAVCMAVIRNIDLFIGHPNITTNDLTSSIFAASCMISFLQRNAVRCPIVPQILVDAVRLPNHADVNARQQVFLDFVDSNGQFIVPELDDSVLHRTTFILGKQNQELVRRVLEGEFQTVEVERNLVTATTQRDLAVRRVAELEERLTAASFKQTEAEQRFRVFSSRVDRCARRTHEIVSETASSVRRSFDNNTQNMFQFTRSLLTVIEQKLNGEGSFPELLRCYSVVSVASPADTFYSRILPHLPLTPESQSALQLHFTQYFALLQSLNSLLASQGNPDVGVIQWGQQCNESIGVLDSCVNRRLEFPDSRAGTSSSFSLAEIPEVVFPLLSLKVWFRILSRDSGQSMGLTETGLIGWTVFVNVFWNSGVGVGEPRLLVDIRTSASVRSTLFLLNPGLVSGFDLELLDDAISFFCTSIGVERSQCREVELLTTQVVHGDWNTVLQLTHALLPEGCGFPGDHRLLSLFMRCFLQVCVLQVASTGDRRSLSMQTTVIPGSFKRTQRPESPDDSNDSRRLRTGGALVPYRS